MPGVIILVLLSVLLFFRLKRHLDKNMLKTAHKYEQMKNKFDLLGNQIASLKDFNNGLEKVSQETIALFNITKDICKSLDIDTVFNSFRGHINKYVKIADCKFVKDASEAGENSGYLVLPLKVHKSPAGSLLVKGLKEEDKEKFHILSQQFILGVKRAYLYQQVQELAITDSLTGAFSRKYFHERLSEETARAKKFNYSLSFLMADVDHFKEYNDRYGHLVGDVVLKEVSKGIKNAIRQIDLMGRYGGEEFAVILTETDKEQARFAAERIRQAIESMNIKAYDENLKMTISIGISTYPEDAANTAILIDKSDWALYRAKQTGRNRVCVYGVYQ